MNRHFQILRDVNRALGSQEQVPAKLQMVLAAVCELVPVSYAAAFLLDKEYQHIDIVAVSDAQHESLVGRRVALGVSALGQFILNCQRTSPVVVSTADEPTIDLLPGDERLLPEANKGFICVPLVGQIANRGGVFLYPLEWPITLDDLTSDLLETIGSQTAIVIEDSLLFTAAQRLAEQMRLVNEVSREIAAIHDLDTILSIIPDRLTGTFGYYHASVGILGDNGIEMYEAAQHSRAVGRERFRIPLQAKGMVPWVARNGRVHLSNDTRQDELWEPGKGLEASRSELTVPSIYRDRIIGIIDVQSEHTNAFDQDDISVLEALAGQVAVTIENARLYDENERQRRFAETLNRVSRLTASILNVHQVTQVVLKELNTLIPYDNALIALLDNDKLQVIYQTDKGAAHDVFRWLVDESPLLYQIVREQEVMLIPDTADHRLWRKSDAWSATRSWVGVPLLRKGQAVGVVAIGSTIPHTYTAQDSKLLSVFLNQIAVTIDNAQLFEKAERREREARTLYEITRLLVTLEEGTIPLSLLDKLNDLLLFDAAGMLLDGEPYRMIIRAKACVTDQAVAEIEERLIRSYNALSGSHVNRQSLQRRVVITDAATNSAEPVTTLPGRLSAPLLHGNYVMGIIELGHVDPLWYADPELRVMLIVANTTVTALENARLYQELVGRAVSLQHAVDELAEVDRLRNELIQNISHELRTPLTFVAGYVELLLAEELGELLPAQREGLEIVAAKTQVLIRLVSDILLQERSAGLSLEFVPVNLAALAEQAVQGIYAASVEAGIQIVPDINPAVEPVLADPTRIGQVFDNLLGNALKFSSSGDTITVRVIAQVKRVRVEIEDTGIGIPADKLPHLFQRFYQVDGTPNRYRGGVGLGLAICKQIIEAHGGIIAVCSQDGVGSTFYFELPTINITE